MLESSKKILFFRNEIVYSSFEELREKIMFHNYNGVRKYDKGSYFVLNEKLEDGEPVIFRYQDKNNINSIYGIVFKSTEEEDQDGNFRNITLFNSYEDFFMFKRINEDFINKPDPEKYGITILNDVNINEDKENGQILTADFYKLKADESTDIHFEVKDGSNPNMIKSILIHGPKNTDTIYNAGNGISLSSTNNFTLKSATNNAVGGVKTSNNTSNLNGFLKCPIKDGYAYYEKETSGNSGNDMKINLHTDRSGWFRFFSSKEIDNYGIFTVSGNYIDRNNKMQSTTITFVASYSVHGEPCITEIAYGDVRPNSNTPKPVIEEIRIKFSNERRIAGIDVYINSINGIINNIEIDGSNVRGWEFSNLTNESVVYPLDNNDPFLTFEEDVLKDFKNNSIKSNNFFQGESNGHGSLDFRVIDSSDYAKTNRAGIIKLKSVTATNEIKSYLKLDGYNVAYAYADNNSTYNLAQPTASKNGGLRLSSSISNFDSTKPEHLSYKLNLATKDNLGYALLGGEKLSNITTSDVATSGSNIPIITNASNRLCLRTDSTNVETATTTSLGVVKLGSDIIVDNNDTFDKNPNNWVKSYYPIILDEKERACAKVPIDNSGYILPVADTTNIGGIKLGAEKVDLNLAEYAGKIAVSEDTTPVFLDKNNRAYISVHTQTKEIKNASIPFTCSISNFELFETMFLNNIMTPEGFTFDRYRKFIIFNQTKTLEVEWFINTFLLHRSNFVDYDCINLPIDVTIYTGYRIMESDSSSENINIRLYKRNNNYNIVGQNISEFFEEDYTHTSGIGTWRRSFAPGSLVRVHIQNVVQFNGSNVTVPQFVVNCEKL